MTIATDFKFERPSASTSVQVLDGSRFLGRVAFRFSAISFALITVLIWLAPGASWESDVMLFKLALSIFSGLVAVGCWQSATPPVAPTVELDIARAEVRLVCEESGRRVIKSCSFADLQSAELNGRSISFWEVGGQFLAQVTLSNATAHAHLLHALRTAGKLD